MSFYVPNLDDVSEPVPVEDGAYEVEIRAAKLELGEGDKSDRIRLNISILGPLPEGPRPPFIFHTLFLPREGETETWKIENTALRLKRFFALFGIEAPDHPLDADETREWLTTWQGLQAKCKVRKVLNQRVDPEQYENELVVPPLARSGSSGATAARSAPAGLRSV